MKNTKMRIINETEVVFYNYNEQTKVFKYLKRSSTKPTQEVVVPLSEMHLGIQAGNIKIGEEFVLNTLPGDHPIKVRGEDITNVRGSCQGCCDGCESFCYAIGGCQQHHNSVLPSVIKNLILYREDRPRFLKELRLQLDVIVKSRKFLDRKKPIIFRWHASGEIENYQYLEDMMMIAEEYPMIHFYSYTKRFQYIARYLNIHQDFPTNFVWNLSKWEDNLDKAGFPEEYHSKVQLFTWDDGNDPSMEKMVHCPAVEKLPGHKKGHLNHKVKCDHCGMCWKGNFKGKTLAVHNH